MRVKSKGSILRKVLFIEMCVCACACACARHGIEKLTSSIIVFITPLLENKNLIIEFRNQGSGSILSLLK